MKGKSDVISINEISINLKEKLGTRTDSIYSRYKFRCIRTKRIIKPDGKGGESLGLLLKSIAQTASRKCIKGFAISNANEPTISGTSREPMTQERIIFIAAYFSLLSAKRRGESLAECRCTKSSDESCGIFVYPSLSPTLY